MSRLALYRKYRSADFDEVVGQEHITGTLEAAITKGMAAHAYLFTGPRGTGKTTVARIVAKRLNELGKQDDISDELDIIEIDGASNRGIDEIRSLREKVNVAPSKLKYKVYIIDEVHMLTREAFNALLKTLEEPPAHVVFIFATTEAQKLPETIISRTQRFDFRPIPTNPLQKQLQNIADKEKIKIDPAAIELIASLSRGGFRDAIGLLDQLSVSEGKITPELVRQFTGLQDPTKLEAVLKASMAGEPNKSLALLQELFNEGADPITITQQMLDMIQAKLVENPTDSPKLLQAAQRLHEAQMTYRYSSLPQLALQVALGQTELKPTAAVSNTESVVQQVPKADKANNTHSQQGSSSKKDKPSAGNQEAKIIKALSIIKHYNNSLYAVLKGSQMEMNDNTLTVFCRFSFHRDRMNEGRNRELIEKAFAKVFGQNIDVKIEVEQAKPNKPSKADAETELVSSAMAILGGELVEGDS